MVEIVMTEELIAALRGSGLRVTQPRLAVLDAVRRGPHSDALAVLGRVRQSLPAVSHQAVYDCLTAMTTAGLLRRIEPAGSPARYEWRRGDNHHHLICRGCGAITDVDCGIGAAPCLSVSNDHGYVIDEAEVVYWGLCPACHLKSAESEQN
ncbi:Fur family transcriptional regulator [Calidifontibacter terrae]